MNEDERGDAFRGIPKLRLLVVLEYYLGVPSASPSFDFLVSLDYLGGATGIPNLRHLPLFVP